VKNAAKAKRKIFLENGNGNLPQIRTGPTEFLNLLGGWLIAFDKLGCIGFGNAIVLSRFRCREKFV